MSYNFGLYAHWPKKVAGRSRSSKFIQRSKLCPPEINEPPNPNSSTLPTPAALSSLWLLVSSPCQHAPAPAAARLGLWSGTPTATPERDLERDTDGGGLWSGIWSGTPTTRPQTGSTTCLRDLQRDTDDDGDEEPSLRLHNPVAVATLAPRRRPQGVRQGYVPPSPSQRWVRWLVGLY
jgi:hypothetical protein